MSDIIKAPPCLLILTQDLNQARMGNNVPQRVKSVQLNIPPADFSLITALSCGKAELISEITC